MTIYKETQKAILKYRSQLKRYFLATAVAWTVVVATALVWNVFETKQKTLETARIQARAAYEKDIIYRHWNAGHGGVYVPVTKETQPNPYLYDVPERDITTPSGKALTLMNPAYMTRQAHELEKQKLGVRGHITSLNPIRPENAPDPWESKALRAFERGEIEINWVEEIEGKEYMRLMRPLITEKGCMKCHAKQGYHEGDIRGGISVSIPMEPFWAIERRYVISFTLTYLVFWMVGLVGLGLGNQRLMRSDQERKRAEEALQKAHDELERKVEERTVELKKVNRALKTLSDCNQALVRITEESQLLNEICSIIVETGGYRMAWVGFAEQDETKTVCPVAKAGYEEGYLETLKITWEDTERGRGPVGTAIRTGELGVVRDILTDSSFAPWCVEASKRGYASVIALPLSANGQTFGALAIYSSEPDAFDVEEVDLLTELADDLAYGIMALRTHTERKQAEEKIRKLNVELEQRVIQRTAELEAANRELEAFSYSVSHDLKAPLRTIAGFSDILLDDHADKLNDEGKRLLNVVKDNTLNMNKLIDALLALSQIGRKDIKRLKIDDMDKLAQTTFDEIKATVPEREIQFNIKPLPPAHGDEGLLHQVFFNLLFNAIKFTRPREVAIIEVGGWDEVKENVYYVRDNGIGFDMQYADKLFMAFQRLHSDKEFEGTGIGLATVQRIIHRHGGRVWAEGKVNEGATFYFTLPKLSAKLKTSED